MDEKFLTYILNKCETTVNILSKQLDIKYTKLFCILHSNRKIKDIELDKFSKFLKENTTLTESYIDKRVTKIRKRNQS